MAKTTTVTFDDILDETDYKARPGVQYEIAEGVIVTMKRPTAQLLKDFDTYGDSGPPAPGGEAADVKEHFEADEEEHFTDILLAKAQMVTEGPDSFDWSLEAVDAVVLQRVCDDFLSLSLVRSRLAGAS